MRFVHHAQRLSLYLRAHTLSHGADSLSIGIGFSLGANCCPSVIARFALGCGCGCDLKRIAFDSLLGINQVDRFFSLGHFDLPRGKYPLFSGNGEGASFLSLGLGLALSFALPSNSNRALLLRKLERLATIDFGGLYLTLLADALLLNTLLATNTCRLNCLTGSNLRRFGVLVSLGPLGGHLSALARTRHFYLALLEQARVLGLQIDGQR
jgi:hypothetical protein